MFYNEEQETFWRLKITHLLNRRSFFKHPVSNYVATLVANYTPDNHAWKRAVFASISILVFYCSPIIRHLDWRINGWFYNKWFQLDASKNCWHEWYYCISAWWALDQKIFFQKILENSKNHSNKGLDLWNKGSLTQKNIYEIL